MDKLTDPVYLSALVGSVTMAVFVSSQLFKGSGARNPFAEDARLPSRPFEHDQEKRDAVYKQG